MRNRSLNRFMALCCAGVLFFGCGTSERTDITPEVREPIAISGTHALITGGTKADPLPDNGRIAVLSALYNAADPQSTDWKSYPALDNVTATAIANAGPVYGYTWDGGQKFWPFDMTQLVFMAYTPHLDADPAAGSYISNDRRSLTIRLAEGMPEYMCASANINAPNVPYTKKGVNGDVSGAVPVDLGTFEHVLSRLTVEIEETGAATGIVGVKLLAVSTGRVKAALDLTAGAGAITVSDSEEYPLIYELVAQNDGTAIETLSAFAPVLVFPATEDEVLVTVELVELANPANVVKRTYPVSAFLDDGDTGVRLVRGENTIVKIIVNPNAVTGADKNIELEGTLTDWNYKGDYVMTIE